MKGRGGEWRLAEKPTLEYLVSIGYAFLAPEECEALRGPANQVLLRTHLIDAIERLNGVNRADAEAAAAELAREENNEEWLKLMRGDFSRQVEGQATHRTLKLIDYQNPANNQFAVTHQLYVQAEKSRKPDIVVYVNGMPLVVIEAKSPLSHKDKNGEAFEQIKQYERDIPRLFATNAFNIVTDGTTVVYGATGAASKFYGYWRDPHPRADDFANELHKGLWCLLDPARLLDLLAHFIVFERDGDTGQTIKKICRYQQFRAVNKMVERVIEGKHRRGLIWHTQGSGKSLTMVFAALKLKHHRTISSPNLTNPNLLVLTDRKDLDRQISGTFIATGLPNPQSVTSIKELREKVASGIDGQTLLSTIFKFEGSKTRVANSERWIVMVDECHRTQEKDLGAYLRATLPDAIFFGFTGTPVKKNDKDTYSNFGVEGEGYLDKYGIDDAVRDGATVPIYYTSRKTDWQIDEAKIDSLFDTWFADYDDATLADIKKRGVKIGDLVKHPKRIDLIAYDVWQHFKHYAKPDGFKAQLVAYDREAIVLYKRALDRHIAAELAKDGMNADEALAAATAMSACVFSKSQEDGKPSEDSHIASIRKDLERWYADEQTEGELKRAFNRRGDDPQILIVCDKLLTGFDAPVEAVMYLDKPLREHTLLQAIARTNRVADAKKKNGLIVDYIGVSQKLDEALESYRSEDVKNALRDLDALRSELKAAHRAVLVYAKDLTRNGKNLKAEYDALVRALGTEDEWIIFQRKVRDFITLYEALAPDPCVLDMTYDLKWFGNFLQFGRQQFEKKESLDHKDFSAKIREMLEEHLNVSGLRTVIKLRSVVDDEFWQDFETAEKSDDDLRSAAMRKTTELRKITEAKLGENPHQYAKFSEKLRELIEKLDDTQLSWSEKLKAAEEYARELDAEARAYEGTGMSEGAHAILRVIQSVTAGSIDEDASRQLAAEVEALYANGDTAPKLWQTKEALRKELRQTVRKMAHRAGVKQLTELPVEIEDIAIKHYGRGAYD